MKKVSLLFALLAFGLALPPLSQEIISKEIGNMVNLNTGRNTTHLEITAISDPVNNLAAVALIPPYREFPNIVLFEYKDDQWQRVFEGLSVGIQDAQSGILDLHVTGLGVDLLLGEKDSYAFSDIEVQALVEDSEKLNLVIIPYQNFLHMHPSGKSSYTIDKTNFFALASQLNDRYLNYPHTECIMYDLPLIKSWKFDFVDNKYRIRVDTDNEQRWEITFSGVEGKFLADKNISVK